MKSRSREKLCIASRLDIDDPGGPPPGCSKGPPCDRPIIILINISNLIENKK